MRYEFMGIIKPFLPEDVRKKLVKSIEKIFTDHKGEVENSEVWGKRHLAYKVKGNEEGYYILYNINIPSEKVGNVEEELRMISDLLRYIIIKKD